MRRFPLLRTESRSWQLPLADSTASQLVDLLLCEDGGKQEPRLADLVATDPALAVWLVCRAHGDGGPRFENLSQLASWFAGNMPRVLDWGEQKDSDGSSVVMLGSASPGDRACWTDLVSRSLQVATLSERLAESCETQVDPAKAYFAGLLHAATEWLESSTLAVAQSVDAPEVDCLPNWLANVLSQTAANSTEDLAVGCVCRAIGLLADSANSSSDHVALIDETKKQVASVVKRWTRRQADTAKILPSLCRRLARLDRLEQQFADTLQTAKLDAMKELAYGAGHEINNPLANISTRAQTMLRGETDPLRRQMLATINRQAFRAHEMISDMMLFARPPEPQLQSCDLSAIITRVVDELQGEAEQQGTTLSVEATQEPLTVDADPRQLEVVARAMCRNSLEAIGGGGQVDIRWRSIDGDAQGQGSNIAALDRSDRRDGWLEIIFEDDGPGMDDREWEHLFDPFFSGREAGRGLGFGLSKCWRIITGHGGRIDVEPRAVRGTRFRVVLPRTSGEDNHVKAAG